MMSDDFEPARKGKPMANVMAEDLDALSVDELSARIAALKSEIARSEARMAFASNHRTIADQLFKK
jgi:uncharacterized small protein (DUF1192 family)